MSTHTAVAATSKGHFDAIQVPTQTPGEGEVAVKVEYASMIAFDTYVVDRGTYVQEYPAVLGFNAAGTVVGLGSGVGELRVGDRVTAFGFGPSRHKTMQEYTVLSEKVVAKIPDSLPLADAATVPDNFVTAFYTLFNQLGLPIPSAFPTTKAPPLAETPILIYGAGSTAGIYAVQLLHLAGYKKIFATASKKHHEYLQSLGASHTFDYTTPTLVQDMASAVGGDGKILLAVDCIAAESTLKMISEVISPLGKLAVLLPVKEGNTVTNAVDQELFFEVSRERHPFPKGTEIIEVRTFNYLADKYLSDNLMPKILPKLLTEGHIKPNRVRLMDQGSFKERVAVGLDLLRNNKVSGEKVIVKVGA